MALKLPSPWSDLKVPIKDDSDGNLNHKSGLCMCIRHTSDTFRAVTRYIDYYAVHSLISRVLWRTLAQDDDFLRFFLSSWITIVLTN